MRSEPFWPTAAASWLCWLAGCALLWRVREFPLEPLRLIPVVALFFVPSLLVGLYVGRDGAMAGWTHRRLVLTCVLACVSFVPWALMTLPVLPLTIGGLIIPIATLAWRWRELSAPKSVP